MNGPGSRSRRKIPLSLLVAGLGIAVIWWTLGGSTNPSLDRSNASLVPPGNSIPALTQLSPKQRVQFRRKPLDASTLGPCAIQLDIPAGTSIKQAEVFAIQNFNIEDEPIVGADDGGVLDLRVIEEIHPLMAVKAIGAATRLVEVSCPGTRQVKLRPEATVSGIVRSRGTNNPAGEALVALSLGPARITVVAASDGRFTLSGLPSGIHELTASTQSAWGATAEPLILAEGDRVKDVTIYVDDGYMLRGTVRSNSQSPLPLKIQLNSSQPRVQEALVTAPGERFEFGPLSAGEYKLVTSADAPVCAASLLRVETVISMGQRDETVVVDIGDRRKLKIRSVDKSGAPVGRVPFSIAQRVERDDGLVDGINRSATTDAAGVSTVCGIFPGEIAIKSQGKDYSVNTRNSEELELLVDTDGDARVHGVLISEEGEPVTRRDVLLIPLADIEGARLERSDDAGAFAFDHVAPGLHRLEVRSTLKGPGGANAGLGLSRAPEVTEELDVHAGEDLEAELLLATVGDVRISGVVLDSAGNPLADALITYSIDRGGCWPPWDAGEGSTTSAADGHFTIDGADGSVPLRLHALRAGLGRGTVGDVSVKVENVRVQVAELASLQVRATELEKFAVHKDQCNVAIVDNAGCTLGSSSLPANGGPVVVNDLPARDVIVTLHCLGQELTKHAAAKLMPHEVVELDLLPD